MQSGQENEVVFEDQARVFVRKQDKWRHGKHYAKLQLVKDASGSEMKALLLATHPMKQRVEANYSLDPHSTLIPAGCNRSWEFFARQTGKQDAYDALGVRFQTAEIAVEFRSAGNSIKSESMAAHWLEKIVGEGYIECGGFSAVKELMEMVGPEAGSRILYINVGPGGVLVDLPSMYKVSMIGTESHEDLVQMARSRLDKVQATSSASVQLVDLSSPVLPPIKGEFEYILSSNFFSTHEDPLRAMKHLFTVVVPGGTLAFSEYCWDGEAPQGSPYPSKQRVLETLTQAGFSAASVQDLTVKQKDRLKEEVEAMQKAAAAEESVDIKRAVDTWKDRVAAMDQEGLVWLLFSTQRPLPTTSPLSASVQLDGASPAVFTPSGDGSGPAAAAATPAAEEVRERSPPAEPAAATAARETAEAKLEVAPEKPAAVVSSTPLVKRKEVAEPSAPQSSGFPPYVGIVAGVAALGAAGLGALAFSASRHHRTIGEEFRALFSSKK